MKNTNAHNFIAALEKDARLRTQVFNFIISANPQKVVALAAHHGYRLTFEEFNEASLDILSNLARAN